MKLSSKAIELMNLHALTAELMARDWAVYLPVYDDGIDLIAARNDAKELIRIQLKSRWTISRRYLERNIEIAFPENGRWYLVPHDEAVAMGELEGYCQRSSWTVDGGWSVASMSGSLTARMKPYLISSRLGNRLIGDFQSASA